MREPAVDADLEMDIRAQDAIDREFVLGSRAHFVVPVLAELGAPQALRSAARLLRAEDKAGEFADAQAGGLVFEGEFHGAGKFRSRSLFTSDQSSIACKQAPTV